METYKNDSGEEKYYVARNDDKSVLHIGELNEGMEISTGQPILEIYSTKQEIIDIYGYYPEPETP